MKHIASAFVCAQKAFAPALKTNTNPHFRSKYADLSACVEAVIDALNANGIGLVQATHECETGVIVETTFIHVSGETMSAGKLHVPASKQDAQGYGSALTYARRYSLMAACGIAPEDDDGNAASKPAPINHKSVPASAFDAMTPEEQQFLRELAGNVLALPTPADQVAMIEASNLDPDEKAALWSLFDSKQRAAMKAASKKAQNDQAQQ